MIKVKYVKTTYAKLEKALFKLKFVKKDTEKYRIYVNEKYDSIIVFPNFHGSKIVSDIHYNGYLMILNGERK